MDITPLTDTDEIELQLRSGERMRADLVVGADGHNSIIRSLAFLDHSGHGTEKFLATLYFTVPRHRMEADNELRTLVDHPAHVSFPRVQVLLQASDVQFFSGRFGRLKGIQ